MAPVLAVKVLGPLKVSADGVDVTPTAPKERALLALLALSPSRAVSVDRLLDELWADCSPAAGRRALQVRVAALRKLLDKAEAGNALEFVAPGYRLSVEPQDVDEQVFSTLCEGARARLERGDAPAAAEMLHEALGLWRGEPLADVQLSFGLEMAAARLADARLAAIEDRIDADLACGRHQQVVSELDALVAVHPLRERLWGQRMLALSRGGRQAEALRAGADIRHRLVEELGVEPGPALRAVEATVLAQHWDLDPGAKVHPVPPNTVHQPALTMRAARSALIGRDAELAGIARLVQSESLVTLVGPGGVGKTSLALETARRDRSEREVAVVSLAPVTDPAALPTSSPRPLAYVGPSVIPSPRFSLSWHHGRGWSCSTTASTSSSPCDGWSRPSRAPAPSWPS